jgi:hypothetical protein
VCEDPRKLLKAFFSGKIPEERTPEALCRCCKHYDPARFADHDCRPASRGECKSHSAFKLRKTGPALMLHRAEVVLRLKEGTDA